METKKLTLTKTISINAPAAEVWDALTNPEKIKQYFFGTQVLSEWKKGSPIKFTGEWEGKTYEDKGTIKDIKPGEYLEYSYWSNMSGKEDIPENYANITYSLSEANGRTAFTLTQDGIESEESKEHSDKNWDGVLQGLKALAEGGK